MFKETDAACNNPRYAKRVNLRSKTSLVGLVGLLACCLPASAQITTYSDRASFLAATSSTTNIDFNGYAGGLYTAYPSLSISGVTFAPTSGTMFVISPAYYFAYSIDGSDVLSTQAGDPDSTEATLPAGVTAVGMDFGGLFYDQTFTFKLSTGNEYTINAFQAVQGHSFAGFTSASGDISWIRMSSPANGVFGIYDNFVFGAAGPSTSVPEPGTFALLGGLAVPGLALLRRRRA